jgi:hypothetical protein
MSVEFAVQKAMDAVLITALDAMDPPVPIYDDVPEGSAFPFVQFLRVISTADNLVASKMRRVQVAIGVYSTFAGQEEVLNIFGVIEDALDDAELTLDEGVAVRCDLERADTVRDADGKTYTGTAIYSVLVDC